MDVYAQAGTDEVNMKRDLETIKARTENEGLSFLTLTLPAFGQGILNALASGRIDRSDFAGWRFWRGIPAFARGILHRIFHVDTGMLRHDADVVAIEGMRMITSIFKKISLPCTPEREQKALDNYVKTELSFNDYQAPDTLPVFKKVCELIWGHMFYGFNPNDCVPKHGPGQTAERVTGNKKFTHLKWNERIEPLFPFTEHLFVNLNQVDDEEFGLEKVDLLGEEQELPVKVALVPKTLKGPRIIAMEPVCMQYVQQAIAAYVIKAIQTSEITGGHINFTDQSINQRLALMSSVSQSLATLDLSDASDRVPLSTVEDMLASVPLLRDAILACRSRTALLPKSDIIVELKKFASMGSALCFPIEAMYFFSVIITALICERKVPVTLKEIVKVSRDVYVYGDDIIVPTDKVRSVLDHLASYHCKVNVQKSFWGGNFRESCGVDAFAGEKITPVYLRELCPKDGGDAKAIVSVISTSNQLYKRGYWHTAQFLKSSIEQLIGELPIVTDESPGLGWTSYQSQLHDIKWVEKPHKFKLNICDGSTVSESGKWTEKVQEFKFTSCIPESLPYGYRWNRKLCRLEVKTYVLQTEYRPDEVNGFPALLKVLGESARNPERDIALPRDKEHLERSPRSGAVKLKRRWTTAY